MPGGALTTYPYKLRPKNFSPPCGVYVHPMHPLATPWPLDLERWPEHGRIVAFRTVMIFTKFKIGQPIRSWVITFLLQIRYVML